MNEKNANANMHHMLIQGRNFKKNIGVAEVNDIFLK